MSIDCRDFDGDPPDKNLLRLEMQKRVSGCNSSFVALPFGLRICRIGKIEFAAFIFLQSLCCTPTPKVLALGERIATGRSDLDASREHS